MLKKEQVKEIIKEEELYMENMKKVYVAHPYGGKEENKIETEIIIKKLVARDPEIFYVSPIHATGYIYNDVSYEQGMRYCFELLRCCDELLLCEGWENSRGCNMEKKFAEDHNIPIKYCMKNLEICTNYIPTAA